jgi:glycosyltransferase involved in cell wall biosynthesis
VDLALADSEFNRRELEAAGYPRTGVLPIVLDLERYRRPSSPVTRRLYGDGRTNLLFVGRIIPNKRIEDLIAVFAGYRRLDPRSRLLLVGDMRGHEAYYARLRERVRAVGLALGDDVVFTGHVDEDDLLACYQVSQVFVCLSEHEGYCVPLVEAMVFGLPVVAFAAGAVPETLRGGGVLLDDKAPETVAVLVHRLVRDAALRERVLAGQRRALEHIAEADYRAVLLDRLAPVLEAA